uniref:MyoD family inhibitor domain containing n=1 Tax=Laticauda laticaudata TaxID=8630 RepID=A0A8C5S953_LATLA
SSGAGPGVVGRSYRHVGGHHTHYRSSHLSFTSSCYQPVSVFFHLYLSVIQTSWVAKFDFQLVDNFSQPQCLPQPNVLSLDKYKEGTSKKQNSPRSLKSESGFCSGVKVDAPDNQIFSAPVSQKIHRKIHSSLSVNIESSKKSSAYSHKPDPFPEDCCVHCILACLFCEFVTLCGLILEQTSCRVCPGVACCCGEKMGDDCNYPCDMDCGIMDACCESSDCLEICMECCGICFPS